MAVPNDPAAEDHPRAALGRAAPAPRPVLEGGVMAGESKADDVDRLDDLVGGLSTDDLRQHIGAAIVLWLCRQNPAVSEWFGVMAHVSANALASALELASRESAEPVHQDQIRETTMQGLVGAHLSHMTPEEAAGYLTWAIAWLIVHETGADDPCALEERVEAFQAGVLETARALAASPEHAAAARTDTTVH